MNKIRILRRMLHMHMVNQKHTQCNKAYLIIITMMIKLEIKKKKNKKRRIAFNNIMLYAYSMRFVPLFGSRLNSYTKRMWCVLAWACQYTIIFFFTFTECQWVMCVCVCWTSTNQLHDEMKIMFGWWHKHTIYTPYAVHIRHLVRSIWT